MGNYYAGMMNNTGGYGELKHHGILGQKWGVRRWQNADGSLTAAGRERYGYSGVSDKDRKKLTNMIAARPRNTEAIKNLPFIQSAAKELQEEGRKYSEASKEFSDIQDELDNYIWDNKDRHEKWLNKAVDNFMRDENADEHMGSREDIYNWFKYDDGDQNERGTFETYIRESGEPMAKKYTDAESKLNKAYSDLRKKADSIANDIYGDGSDANMNKFWTSVFIQDAAKEYAESSSNSIPKTGMPKVSLRDRIGNFYNGRTNGETDSTKVKDLTLRRQMENNIRSNTKLQDNWDFRGKSAKEERDLSKNFVKTSVKEFNNSKKDQKSWQKAKADAEKYMRNVAKIRLESMGYEASNKAIDNLVSKDWFKNSLWIQNTLASMGADGVKHTSKDDMRFR